MVTAAAHSMEWQVSDPGHSLMGGDNRCSQVRLGGLVETCRSTAKRRGRDPGLLLEQGREKLQQLERTDRHQLHGSGSSAQPARSVSLGGDRQHNFGSIHQPHGGSTLEAQLGGQGAVGVLPASQHPVASNSSSRSRQCESRSAEPSQVRPDRLQAETGGVPAHQPSVRPAYYRPDGGPLEHPAAPLHQSISRSAGSRHRYFSVESDGGEWIYPSSTSSHIKSSISGGSTRGSGNSSYTKLEGPMVATAPADVNLQASSAALSSSVAHSRASKGKVPALQLPARSSRMEDLRSAMLSNGYAKPVVDHALKRWAGGSNDDSYWRHWKQWCIDSSISPLAGEMLWQHVWRISRRIEASSSSRS